MGYVRTQRVKTQLGGRGLSILWSLNFPDASWNSPITRCGGRGTEFCRRAPPFGMASSPQVNARNPPSNSPNREEKTGNSHFRIPAQIQPRQPRPKKNRFKAENIYTKAECTNASTGRQWLVSFLKGEGENLKTGGLNMVCRCWVDDSFDLVT